MLKWSIELCGYDITCTPRTAIKAQALANFIAKTSFTEKYEETSTQGSTSHQLNQPNKAPCPKAWTILVNRVVNSRGPGVGIILKSPSQSIESQCIKLDFSLSNNQAEYEALIIGLLWAQEIGIQSLKICSTSQVVVGQMNDEYAIKSDNLKDYAEMTKRLITKFKYFLLQKVGRDENTEADKLAKIGSRDTQGGDSIEIEVRTSPSLILHVYTIVHLPELRSRKSLNTSSHEHFQKILSKLGKFEDSLRGTLQDYVIAGLASRESEHRIQFSSKFTDECERLHIRHWKSSVTHHQGNGQAEAANKMVMVALKNNLAGKSNKWVDELPSVLWAVRTMLKGRTGETPYAMVYGSKAISPVELALPTAKVDMFDDDQNLKLRTMDLDLLEEQIIAA